MESKILETISSLMKLNGFPFTTERLGRFKQMPGPKTIIVGLQIIPTFIPKTEGPGDDSNFEEYDEDPLRISLNNKYSKDFLDF